MELKDAGPAALVGRMSDRELWAPAVDGDREAFGRILDRHARTVDNHLFPGPHRVRRGLGADRVGGRTVPVPFGSKNPIHVEEVAR